MNTSSLISASQVLSQSVAAMVNNAALVSHLHDAMLGEVRDILERTQALEVELAETKEALKKAYDELAALKGPAKVEKEDSIAYGDDIEG